VSPTLHRFGLSNDPIWYHFLPRMRCSPRSPLGTAPFMAPHRIFLIYLQGAPPSGDQTVFFLTGKVLFESILLRISLNYLTKVTLIIPQVRLGLDGWQCPPYQSFFFNFRHFLRRLHGCFFLCLLKSRPPAAVDRRPSVFLPNPRHPQAYLSRLCART